MSANTCYVPDKVQTSLCSLPLPLMQALLLHKPSPHSLWGHVILSFISSDRPFPSLQPSCLLLTDTLPSASIHYSGLTLDNTSSRKTSLTFQIRPRQPHSSYCTFLGNGSHVLSLCVLPQCKSSVCITVFRI